MREFPNGGQLILNSDMPVRGHIFINDPGFGGYFLINNLAEKYGYAKDHVGWLARTGRIEAVRCGKYGRWYARESSLLDYRKSLTEKSRSFSTKSPAVLLSAPSHNKSSYSAKSFDKTSGNKLAHIRSEGLKRNNAIPRKLLLVVGGILFFSTYVWPNFSEHRFSALDSVNFKTRAVIAEAQEFANRIFLINKFCVGKTCITEQELRMLLEQNGIKRLETETTQEHPELIPTNG